jgi:hypothetical protein
MGPPSCMRSVIDRNVVMGRVPVFSCALLMFLASTILIKPFQSLPSRKSARIRKVLQQANWIEAFRDFAGSCTHITPCTACFSCSRTNVIKISPYCRRHLTGFVPNAQLLSSAAYSNGPPSDLPRCDASSLRDDDEGTAFLPAVVNHTPKDSPSHFRSPESSVTLPWEPHIFSPLQALFLACSLCLPDGQVAAAWMPA